MMGDLSIQSLQPKSGHFETRKPFRGLCVVMMLSLKVFLKHFASLRNSFFKSKIRVDADPLFLKVGHFIGLQQLQNPLNRDVFKRRLHNVILQ